MRARMLALIISSFGASAYAAPVEQVVTVESWSLYIRNGVDYNFEIKVTDTLSTTCTAANQLKTFTNWLSSNANLGLYTGWQSALQYASATDANTGANRNKVKIRYDPATCDATRGALLLGVRNVPVAE